MGVPGRGQSRLVGHSREREDAAAALRAGHGVLFAGAQGVGKTALARAAAEDFARETGAEVLWVGATEAPIPFGPFARLVPEIGAKAGRRNDTFTLLQHLRGAIARRAETRSLILVVDDADRLDACSAELLVQLMADGTVRPVMAFDTGAAVSGSLRLLWKEELVERIEVGPLDHDSTVDLVTDLLQPAVDEGPAAGSLLGAALRVLSPSVGGEVSDAVWQMSRGNPLFARELVREGRRTGRISLREGVWRLDAELEIGPRLAELVGDRLRPLRPAERETLELVAFAEPLPLAVLLHLSRSSDLETLEAKGLLSFELAGGERVAKAGHPLIGQVIRRSIPVTRATGIGLRLAEALEADGRAHSDLVRVTSWRLDGGAEPGADLLVRASRRAARRQDWAVSARLAEAAVSRGAGTEATIALADAHRALGRFPEALQVLGDEQGEGDDQIARTAVLRASVLFFGFGRLTEALDALAGAHERIDDPSNRTWVQAMRAGLTGFAGSPAEAVDLAEKLLAEPGLRPHAEMTVRTVLSFGLAWTGHTERALEVLDGMDPGPDAMADLPTWMVTARLLGYRLSGRPGALEEAARSSYEWGLQIHDTRVIGPAAAALGWTAMERAEFSRAVGWFREAAAALRTTGALTLRVPALLGLSETLAFTGHLEAARAALDEARPAAEKGALLMPSWSIASAWVAAAQGAMSEALERLEETAADAMAAGLVASEMQALHAAVRLGSAAPAERLAELAEWVEGPLIQIVADHAAALARPERLGEALDDVAGRYADLGLDLFAAEAAAAACRAHESAGRSRKAAASAARAHFVLGSRDDGPPPLGLVLALTPPELTRREREVAMLAAGGLPSQAIATRLCLSVRTVDTHLARVYVKLGIGGRSELQAALSPAANAPDRVETG